MRTREEEDKYWTGFAHGIYECHTYILMNPESDPLKLLSDMIDITYHNREDGAIPYLSSKMHELGYANSWQEVARRKEAKKQ